MAMRGVADPVEAFVDFALVDAMVAEVDEAGAESCVYG